MTMHISLVLRFSFSLAWALGALLVSGCALATSAPPLRIEGRTFAVTAIDGQVLPTTLSFMGRGRCYEAPLARATLAFLPDGTFEQTLWRTDDLSTSGSIFRTSYRMNARGQIQLSDSPEIVGHLRGDTVELRIPPALICYSHTWLALATQPYRRTEQVHERDEGP